MEFIVNNKNSRASRLSSADQRAQLLALWCPPAWPWPWQLGPVGSALVRQGPAPSRQCFNEPKSSLMSKTLLVTPPCIHFTAVRFAERCAGGALQGVALFSCRTEQRCRAGRSCDRRSGPARALARASVAAPVTKCCAGPRGQGGLSCPCTPQGPARSLTATLPSTGPSLGGTKTRAGRRHEVDEAARCAALMFF